MTRLACIITVALCWAPFGLIHQGQRMVNDTAEPILLAQECEHWRADWRGCR